MYKQVIDISYNYDKLVVRIGHFPVHKRRISRTVGLLPKNIMKITLLVDPFHFDLDPNPEIVDPDPAPEPGLWIRVRI